LNRFSLTWTKNNIQTSTGQFDTTTLPFFNPGIDLDLQKIKLIIHSDYGCTDFLEKSILVKPDAKAFFSSSKYVNCAPFIIPIETFLQYPTTNSGYIWEKEDVSGTWVPISSGTTLPTETLQVANQTLKIRLIAQSKWGCKNDTMVRIYQTKDNPKPFFDFVNDSSGCTPYTVQVRSLSTPAGVSHQWILPVGVTGSNNSGITNTLVGVNPGNVNQTYTVKLIVGDASSGCKDSVEHPFTVFPLPRPDFSFSNPRYCFPDSGLATYIPLSPPRIDSLLWTFGTDSLKIRKNRWNTSLTNNTTYFIFQDNTSGIDRTDSLKLIAKSFQGCIDSVSKTFIVSTRPISRFEFNDTTKCGPDTASVSYQSLYSTSQIGWSVNSPLVSILNPTSTQPIFGFPKNTGLVDEVYTITLCDTSANGCVDRTKREIKIHPQPRPVYGFSPTIGCGPLKVLFNDNSVLRTSLLWNFSANDSSINPIDSFIFPTPLIANTTIFFNLKVVTHFGCEENVRDSVIVRPGPVAKFAVKDTFFCLGNQASVTDTFFNRSYGSIDTFTWYFGDGDSLITTRDTTVYHSYSKEGIYTVILKGVNPCGVSTDTFQVEVLEKPKAKFTLSDTSKCGPVNLSITNQTTNIQVTYAWEIGNVDTVLPQITPITSTNFNPGVNTLSADILNGFDKKYYVRLIVKNRCASDTLWDTITVRPKPTALFTPNPKTGCAPKFVTLFNNSRGEPNIYQWEFSDTASFTTTTNTIDPIRYYPYVTQPTKYWIKLTATNACGVDFMSDTVLITPNTIQAGMSVISGQKYHCESGNVGFVNTSSGATTFFWNFGDGTTAITTLQPGANVIYHQYSRVGTFVVSMRASNGCSDTTFFDTVFVFPKPKADINVNRLNFCPGDTVILTGDSSLNASTYQWNFGDGTGWKNTLGSNPKYVYSTPGSYTISLVVSRQILDSRGVPIGIFCYDTATVNITIQPIPTAIIGSNAGPNDCSPFLATFNDLSTGSIPSQSLWNFGDGGTGIGSPVSHMYQNWGVFQVQLVVFNALGCSNTAYTNVRVYEGPRAQFTVSKKDSCGPHQVQFTNTTQFTGPQNVLAYEWAIDSGITGNFTVMSTSKDYNTTFYGSSGSVNPTRYLVRLKVNTNQPCIGFAYDTITIYPKAKATVGINIPDSHCAPFAILPSNVTVNHYSDANSSYTWYANDSLISGPKTNSAFPGFQFSFPDSQVTIKLVVQSKNGCSADSSEKTFFTYPNPISQFDIDIDSGCTPHFTMIRGRAVPGVVNYQWILGRSGSFNSGYSSTSKPLLGTNWVNLTDTTVIDTIWLMVRNPLTGCSDTSWKTIKIYPKPHAGIVSRDSLCSGDSIHVAFDGDSIPPAIQSYRWFWVSNPNNYGSILRPNDSASAIQFNTVKGSFVIRHNIKLEVSTIHGCKDTIEKSIFLKPLPVIAFTDPLKEICVPASVTFKNDSNQIGATYSWTTSTPVVGSTFNPNSSDSLRLFYFDRQGVKIDTFQYSVTMTDLRGCTSSGQTQVITHPRPLNDYANLIETICPGNYTYNNLSIGEQPMTYLWKIDSANRSWTSTSVNFVHPFRNNTINPINYFDTLFSTSAFGCKDTISGNKTVYPKPISSFSSNFVTPSCAPIQLNNSHFTVNTLPTTNVSFQWLVNGSPITAIQAVPNFPGYNFPTPNDSFTVSLVAFSMFNCGSDTETIIFRTHPNPVASFVLDSLQGCSPLQMGATSNSSPGSLNHFWSLGSSNGSFIFPSTPTTSPRIRTVWTNNSTSNNNESITLSVVQPTTGCSSSVTQNFVTYPKPQANITGIDSVCAGGFIPLNYNQTPGRALPAVVGGVQWSWIVNQPAAAISNPTSTTTFINFPDSQGVGVTRYQLIQVITTASGCTDTASKDLWMKQRPKVLIASHASNLCVPFSTTLTNLGTQNGASYSWSSSLGNYLMNLNNPNSSSTLVNFLDRKGDRDTTYTFEMKMTDARGCRDSATTSITTHPRPLTAFTPINDQVCPNTTTTFTNSTIGQQPVTYLWKINQWTSNSSSPTFTFTNPNFRDSTYFDTLISTSVYGCKDTLSGTRIVWYNPKSRIGRIATNHCEPFIFNPVDSSRGHQSFRNRWILTNNGVTVKDVVGINPNFNPIPQSSTPYQLVLITTNQYLCLSDTDSMTFYVRPKPKAQYTVDTNRICTGAGLIRFTNQSQIFSGTNSYFWNFGDSSLIDTNFSPSHFYSKPRAYWSSLLVRSDYGCIDSASKIIFIGKRAKAEFTADLTKGCDTVRVKFNNLSLFSDSAQWDFGNGLQSSTFSPSTYFTSKPGTYTVTLRAIGMFGCDETIVKPAFIRVYEKPIANFDVDSLEKWLPFRTFRFTNRTKGDPYSSQWFFGDGNVGFGKNAAHAYRDTGWYNVKLVVTGDTTGCIDSITKRIRLNWVDCFMKVPNAFQPEGPSEVNLFNAVGSGFETYKMEVYSSWGELLYRTTQLNPDGSIPMDIGWDGKHHFKPGYDKLLPLDTYIYKIEAKCLNGKDWKEKAGNSSLEKRVGTFQMIR
jgi:PKD repeat protein